ncbi:MAG: hypothetical protein JXR19_00915 [Bacteroidia bacterium]
MKKWQKEHGHKTKYFCVGRNKTGTSSLDKAFQDLNFKAGNHHQAALLLRDYFSSNFDPIIEFCKTAQVFQDIPFSYPNTYKILDEAFPNSKFILTVRDSSEQWYNSVVRFHSKLYGEGSIPTATQLKTAGRNVWEGWIWESVSGLYGTDELDPYDRDKLIPHYEAHNQEVKAYFKDRPEDLLVINLSNKDSYKKFCKFIQVESPFEDFPWENKT